MGFWILRFWGFGCIRFGLLGFLGVEVLRILFLGFVFWVFLDFGVFEVLGVCVFVFLDFGCLHFGV